MNLSGGEMGMMALVGLLLFGGLLKAKSKPNESIPKSSTKLASETNVKADFQKANTTSSSPVKVSDYSKAN